MKLSKQSTVQVGKKKGNGYIEAAFFKAAFMDSAISMFEAVLLEMTREVSMEDLISDDVMKLNLDVQINLFNDNVNIKEKEVIYDEV